MSLFSWFQRGGVSEAEIRAEIWRLGSRHRGWPLEGAQRELKAPGVAANQVVLLRACIRKLQHP